MKNRVLSFIVLTLLLISMVACSAEKAEIDNENKVVEENIQSDEQNSADLKLFEEFDLLKIEREENSIQNGFVKADFIIQNKSDSLTISNFVFEYVVDNGSGTPLTETFRTNEHDGLFVLEPRQKAELGLLEYIGSEINDDMRIFILSYSYDLSDKNYVIDIVNQNVVISDTKNKSNVSYEEKNVISFDSSDIQAENKCSFVNVGESDIKTLDISVAIYNEDNVLHSIKSISVVATGEKAIGSNEKGNVRINEIYTRDNGYLVPVYYTYGTGTADQQGYNFFEVNLITKEAVGSTNIMLLDNTSDMSADELTKEIELYTSTFGKKITDTSFDGYKLEERVGSEWLHFYDSTLFGVQGIATLVRDYDTLILTDFWFNIEEHDEVTAAHVLKALELVYGKTYESETEGNTLVKAKWNLEKYTVEFDAEHGSVHVDTDIEDYK